MINYRGKCKYNTRIDSSDTITGFCEKNQEEFYLNHNLSECPSYTLHNCTDCKFLEYDENESTLDDYSYCTKGHDLLLSCVQPDECKEFESAWST